MVRLDANRAVVQVAGNWMGMVQSRASLLEQAVAKALGGNRQLVLEASSGTVAPAPVVAPPTPKPVTPPVIQPITPPAPPAAATSPTKPEPSEEVDPIPPPAPTPVAATVASPKPAVPAEVPHSEQSIARPSEERPKPEPQTPPTAAADIDRHAKTLANFFNGEVLAVDDIGAATNTESSQ